MYKFLPNTCTHFFIIQKKAEILVKRAGVRMDSGKLEEAISLFDAALELDPSAVDALLHRANLRMLEQSAPDA